MSKINPTVNKNISNGKTTDEYLKSFISFWIRRHDEISIDAQSSTLNLCRVVERALSQHDNLTPKQDIMKSAMNICKGTMNPADVRLMIDSCK